MPTAVVTGSAGLIGSEACRFFHKMGYRIIGIDNDMRSYFFGKDSSTNESKKELNDKLENYEHHNVDIRDFESISNIFKENAEDIKIVIHTAAQPSHDWAAREPLTDFTINANGTINLLEATRQNSKEVTFI